MKKSFVILPLVVLVVLGFWYYQKNRVEAREFVGKVQKVDVENQSLTVEGVYTVENRPDLSNPSNSRTVVVTINKDTEIIKERLKLPTLEEVEKTGGRYDPNKLEKEFVRGSLGDIKEGETSVRITADRNIYDRPSFIAGKITFIEPVYP